MLAELGVVICTQGRQPLLRHLLAALLEDEEPPHRVAVVVGDPEARIDAWLPERADARARVRVVEVPHAGLNHKRNLGVATLDTELLAFTDDDCVPAPGWARACREALAHHAVVTGRVLPLNHGYKASLRTSPRAAVHRPTWWNRAHAWRLGCGNNLAMRRAAFDAVGGFCERIGVGTWSQAACDSELLFRVLSHGMPIAYEPAAVVWHAQPLHREAWLAKRRGYYRGVSFLARRVHPRSTAAWAMALLRLGACQADLALSLLSLRRRAMQRSLLQLRGAWEGLCPPGEAP